MQVAKRIIATQSGYHPRAALPTNFKRWNSGNNEASPTSVRKERVVLASSLPNPTPSYEEMLAKERFEYEKEKLYTKKLFLALPTTFVFVGAVGGGIYLWTYLTSATSKINSSDKKT